MKPMFFLLLYSLFFLTVACNKSNNSQPIQQIPKLSLPNDITANPIQLNSIPLKVGNTWTYTIQTQQYCLVQNSPIASDTFSIAVTADTFINGFLIIKLMATSQGAPYSPFFLGSLVLSSTEYYYQDSTGLYQLPALDHVDSNYIKDSTWNIVQYPSVMGNNWASEEPNGTGDPNLVYQWVGSDSVIVPTGRFNCVKLNITNPMLSTYQYYSAKGLIQAIQAIYLGPELGPGKGPIYNITVIRLIGINF